MQLLSSYSGKPGCMCGCKGRHIDASDNPKAVKAAYTRLLKNPAHQVEDFADADGTCCIYVETATRHNVVYYTK